jgi:GNAT superfamily N-acetyltransferase
LSALPASIRPLHRGEINLLKDLPPEDWQIDLPATVSRHFDAFYFHATVATIDEKIVGFGNGILNGSVGWLGNILVLPAYRNRGIGYRLVEYFVHFFNERGCVTQLLVATEFGERLYRKFNFWISSHYAFFRGASMDASHQYDSIRKAEPGEQHQLFDLDQRISGEARLHLIEHLIPSAWVHTENGTIDGMYLPDFGNGWVAADNPTAGLDLLKFKLSQSRSSTAVVPIENETALDFLKAAGYTEYERAPRMVLGREATWQPKGIFSRATGHTG